MSKKRNKQDPYRQREAQKYEEPIASREFILEHLRAHKAPCTFEGIGKLLKIKKAGKMEALRRRLTAMLRDGQLLLNRRQEYLPINDRDLISGRVIAHPDGYGFLRPDEGGEDLFISAHQMRSLLHEDRVVVCISSRSRRGKVEAKVLEVLERGNKTIVGRLHIETNINFVVADNKRIHQDILIPDKYLKGAQAGQIVIAEIVEQPTQHRQPVGKIIEVLGDHMAPGMEIEVAINAHSIPYQWTDEIEHVIKQIKPQVTAKEKQGRLDLRSLPLLTIDGEDAKDFDDAIYVEKLRTGWRLIVAIADVSHYVKAGAVLDDEAYNRGTSVYFPGQVVPMLPEILSNELCSLKPKVDRLCLCCEMRISATGELKSYTFHEAVMHSHARLTYTEVADVLQQKSKSLLKKYAALLPHLQDAYSLYKVLKKIRARRGAIEFDTVETRIVFGESKKIEQIVPQSRNDAHRMIEEFMILANIAAARFLDKHKIPGLYRVHEEPPMEKVEDLKSFLGGLGISFATKQKPKANTYANLLKKIQPRDDSRLIETVLLRSLSQAVYTPDNAGHFGLALAKYAHFTSPIRRYPDLLVHRAIRHIINKQKVEHYNYTDSQMRIMGEHCSMTERRADDATRDAVDWLKCEYMLDKIGESFTGLITGVTSFGLFVELDGVYVEGLIHVTALGNDYYRFDAVTHTMSGEKSGQIFRLADPIKVTVKHVDLDERKIDLLPVLKKTTRSKGRTATKKRKRSKR